MMKLDLGWVRTILVAIAFVWVMLAWHRYDERARTELERFNALVANACSGNPRRELRFRRGSVELE